MIRSFPELPDWSFDIDEVSNGVYKVVVSHRYGHKISKTGIDPEALIDDCRREATDMRLADRPTRAKSIFGPKLGITEMPEATNILNTAIKVPR
ncbi:hypothetical protein [Methylocaldum sp. 14B]|jgi:hypothetical protein|uniref:hypothetical protein n=1 Tax=unclassified Methylocaldum TaxID=2622260 RepID=UPI00098A00A8|nr:hypothetical protein [Methylocaldum sp. 14B]